MDYEESLEYIANFPRFKKEPSLEEMKKLQSEKLVKQVKHVYDNVPYYRELMDKKGVKPEDIHGIEDLHLLPFLMKSDLFLWEFCSLCL